MNALSYLREPGFYVAVLVAALVVNFIWRFFTGKGKIV